jgi:hypothetical protein
MCDSELKNRVYGTTTYEANNNMYCIIRIVTKNYDGTADLHLINT